MRISADVYRDGHDILAGRVRWRPASEEKWLSSDMEHLGNDRWEAVVEPAALGLHEYVIEAWTDRLATLAHDIEVKQAAGEPVDVELEEVRLETVSYTHLTLPTICSV